MSKLKGKVTCFRCNSEKVVLSIDMGVSGSIWFCVTCWAGLAICMAKDIKLFSKKDFWDQMMAGRKLGQDIVNRINGLTKKI